MNITKYGLLFFFLVVIMTVSLFGGYFGFTVNGVPQAGYSSEDPGIFGALEWVWDSILFLFFMTTFQIDNMPVFISAVFVVMSLMVILIIVSLIRGTD